MDAAIAELETLFRPDGYDVVGAEHDDAVELRVVAGAEACADCLVPKDIMRGIVSEILVRHGALRDGGDVVLIYPNDA